MKGNLFPENELQTRLCYSLIADVMDGVERDLSKVKSTQFSQNNSWSYGKRLRPIVFLLSNLSMRVANTRSLDVNDRELKFASAIELLHEASIIQADITDKNNAERSKPTLQIKHDKGLSLLISDFLIFQGLKLILDSADFKGEPQLANELENVRKTIARGEAKRLERYLNQCSIYEKMNIENYLNIIASKTAVFFSGCSEAGATLGGADSEARKNFREFGINLGLLFHMLDDMIDILGDESVVKKNLEHHINEGVVTLPIIHAWTLYPNHNKLEKFASNQAINSEDAHTIYSLLSAKQVVLACKHTIHEYIDKISKNIDALPKNIYSSGLADIIDYIKYSQWVR